MTKVHHTLLCLLTCLVMLPAAVSAQERGEEPDEICRLLFETYLARRGKVNASTIMAASHIVAERGRDTGFWRNVLSEFQKEKEDNETACLRVLGKMLSIDALARDVIRRREETGEVSQWAAQVCLGPEVVDEIVERGKKADRSRADHYAIALARARVPEAADFFRMILRDDNRLPSGTTARFYAAVGLAQLGESAGFEWLIANSTKSDPVLSEFRPSRFACVNLGPCCRAALRELSGGEDLGNRQDWEQWWNEVDRESLPKGHVQIGMALPL